MVPRATYRLPGAPALALIAALAVACGDPGSASAPAAGERPEAPAADGASAASDGDQPEVTPEDARAPVQAGGDGAVAPSYDFPTGPAVTVEAGYEPPGDRVPSTGAHLPANGKPTLVYVDAIW